MTEIHGDHDYSVPLARLQTRDRCCCHSRTGRLSRVVTVQQLYGVLCHRLTRRGVPCHCERMSRGRRSKICRRVVACVKMSTETAVRHM